MRSSLSTQLHISSPHPAHDSLNVVPHMPFLRSLNLSNTSVPSVAALIAMVASSKLTSIDFSFLNEPPGHRNASVPQDMDEQLTKWLKREPLVGVALAT
ncbi:Aste57867_10227 [Aphanomyces stellatus]|uniref:Aste57867_10227 protein n=1 Tax=Aphanomyces stellatus TaxID=120398 RepID=A0A485KPT7_9STRA|nr:hypothetical protein As57867_010188 [Aphanomyces stellatus]VFT87102.1 Aste57867_10227 [Aphanomyces stellatus]